MELTLKSVKAELAALYFINILGAIFLPAAAVSAFLFIRLKGKIEANRFNEMVDLDGEQYHAMTMLTSHMNWLKNLYTVFFAGIVISAIITFVVGSVTVGIYLLFGLFGLFLLMTMVGYFKVLTESSFGVGK